MGRTNGKLRPVEMSFEVAAGDSEGLLRALAVLGHGTLRDGGRCHDMGADSCRMQSVEAICQRLAVRPRLSAREMGS